MNNLVVSAYKSFGDVETFSIRYQSQGHWVNGFLARPKEIDGKLPCIIFNRGGSFEFGAINDRMLEFQLAQIASWGYVVIGSQYSGNAGSEGQDELGGNDLEDVLNLKDCLSTMPEVDIERIGMMGFSRGGAMTYQALARVDWIRAAVVAGAWADLDRSIALRPEMNGVYEKGFGNTPEGRRVRSAVHFVDKLCKTSPILIMHGTADWRVSPLDSYEMSQKCLAAHVPHRLIIFEGAEHGLKDVFDEAWGQARLWFDRYVKNDAPLPNLEPHGK